MNLQHSRDPWSRLTTAARQARDLRDDTAPYGFATRVTALAFAQESHPVSLLERFAFRAVAMASLLALGSVALNYSALTIPPAPTTAVAVRSEEIQVPTLAADDTVALVLDFAD